MKMLLYPQTIVLEFRKRVKSAFFSIGFLSSALGLFGTSPLMAQAPDLTAGGVTVNDQVWFNLGPTGVQAWVYRGAEGNPKPNTGRSRQILVKAVETGSPAAGTLQVGDVILGVDGSGNQPVSFTSDARIAFGLAIGVAEVRSPATLKMSVWRAGVTSTKTVTLRTMGAYSPTAPYNCPKSEKILEEGLDHIMANEDGGFVGIGALPLMAANDPANPDNVARQAKAKTYALAQILSPSAINSIQNGNVERGSKIAWDRGLRLVVLSEYYLQTGDVQVLPSIEACALSIAHGQGSNGAVGHRFNISINDGAYNEPFSSGYTMNASTLPATLGLVMARKCGVTVLELDPAIERATRTLAGNAGLGSFNYYVEGEPLDYNEENGKSGLGAILFALQDDRTDEARFFSKLATGGTAHREDGHIVSYFNYLWGPLGSNVGGQEAAAGHFGQIRWMMDLCRHWDGGFEYERYNHKAEDTTPNLRNGGQEFWMSTAVLLTYAMPQGQLEITGRTFVNKPELVLNTTEVAESVLSDYYDASERTTVELLEDLRSEVTNLADKAAKELANRSSEATTYVPLLIIRAEGSGGKERLGACRALGEIGDDRALIPLIGLLSDNDGDIRYLAAAALEKFPVELLREQINALLEISAANARPAFPMDRDDPQQYDQLKLAAVVARALDGNISGIRREVLYPAIRAFAKHPHGVARAHIAGVYDQLTPADVIALSDVLIEGVNYSGLTSSVNKPGYEGIKLLQRDGWAEGVSLIEDFIVNSRFDDIEAVLDELEGYGPSATTVIPNSKIIEFLDSMLSGKYESLVDDARNAQITAIRDALLAANNPPQLLPLKNIQSTTASSTVVTLPSRQTRLSVTSTDLSKGDTIYSWRKIHGPGTVLFSTNHSSESASPSIYFEDAPGRYLFEVRVRDSRNLTEVIQTVAVELRESGGALPANAPPTAETQSANIAQGIATPITLTGIDPEGYPLVFEVVDAPAKGTLTGTAPYFTYTSDFEYTGSDSLTFRVMDSDGQWSAPAMVNFTVSTRIDPVGLAVYEPADYPVGDLDGVSGSTEVGLAGSWEASSNSKVVANSLAYGSLPTIGESLLDEGSSRSSGYRDLLPSALAQKGLLDDGETLWFSVELGLPSNAALIHLRKLRLGLMNSKFNFSGALEDGVNQPGQGVGIYMKGTKAYAAAFFDSSALESLTIPSTLIGTGFDAGNHRLLVGKITWGENQDTIELYTPALDLTLGEAISIVQTSVDQSTFDKVGFYGSGMQIDELRMGATLESVLLGTVQASPDTLTPTPDPMTFAIPPAMASPTSVTMLAATAFDRRGVEYYFTASSAGGNNSGWQSSPRYTDTDLAPGMTYSYSVKARDFSPAQNETAQSAIMTVTSPANSTLPDLVNLTQAEAQAFIEGAGFSVGTITSSPSSSIEAGSVTGQSAIAGSSIPVGSTINLVVSSTVQMETVPNVIGQTEGAAAIAFEAVNLGINGVLTDYSETVPAGLILSQDPASGDQVPSNSRVNLIISAGSDAGIAPLTPIFFEDFESPDVDATAVINPTTSGSLPDSGQWGITTGNKRNGYGVIDKSSEAFSAPDPNHQAFAIRSRDAGIVSSFAQIGNFAEATRYTIAVDIVKDSGQNNGTSANINLRSFAQTDTSSASRDKDTEGVSVLDQSASAPVNGDFKTVTFDYIAEAGDPNIGRDIALRFTGGQNGAHIDNVRVWSSGQRLGDSASPRYVSTTPADQSSSVAPDSDLTVTFNETVVEGVGIITLKNVTDGTQRTLSVNDLSQVTISDSSLIINPSADLLLNKNYVVLISFDSVRDLAGNPFAGSSNEPTWSFLTADSTPNGDPYSIWTSANGMVGTNALMTADPDLDGLSNLLEFSFGTDPNVSDHQSLLSDGTRNGIPIARSNGDNIEFLFVRRDDHGASGSVLYTVQFSSDLTTFYDSTIPPVVISDSSIDSAYEIVKVIYPEMLIDAKPPKFARLKVIVSP